MDGSQCPMNTANGMKRRDNISTSPDKPQIKHLCQSCSPFLLNE